MTASVRIVWLGLAAIPYLGLVAVDLADPLVRVEAQTRWRPDRRANDT